MGYALTVICCLLLFTGTPAAALKSDGDAGYSTYSDPSGRFTFDYPATMKVRGTAPDEVTIFHPGATLRISMFVEKRSGKGEPKVAPFLAAFKKRLKEDMKESTVLEEGITPVSGDRQGYMICAFRDQRNIVHVQLVHYCVGDERVLQMIISDRPQGFKNLEPVIRKIHRSLKIIDPKLGA